MGKIKRERRSDVAATGLCAFSQHYFCTSGGGGGGCLLLALHRLLVFNLVSK